MVIKTKKGSMAGRGIDALFTAPSASSEFSHSETSSIVQTENEPAKQSDVQTIEHSDSQLAKQPDVQPAKQSDAQIVSSIISFSNNVNEIATISNTEHIISENKPLDSEAAKLTDLQPSGLQSVSTAKRLDAKILEKEAINEGRIKRTLYLTKDQNRMLLELYHIYQIEGKKLEFSELVGKGIELLYEKHK